MIINNKVIRIPTRIYRPQTEHQSILVIKPKNQNLKLGFQIHKQLVSDNTTQIKKNTQHIRQLETHRTPGGYFWRRVSPHYKRPDKETIKNIILLNELIFFKKKIDEM